MNAIGIILLVAAVVTFMLFIGFMAGIYKEDARAVTDGFLIHKGQLYIVTKAAPAHKSKP